MDLKAAVLDKYREVVTAVSSEPSNQSSFYETGKLTPKEFVEAGDKLIQACPLWKWSKAANSKLRISYLPEEKQFL
jgi:ubiquitin-like-conjugating enzyme ATG3